jgi:hypothetical protein
MVLIGTELPGGLTDANIVAARNTVRSTLGFDPTSAANVDTSDSSSASASVVEKVHGVYLASLFQFVKDNSGHSLLDAISNLVGPLNASKPMDSSLLLQKSIDAFLSSTRNKSGVKDHLDLQAMVSSLGGRASASSNAAPVAALKPVSVIVLENAKTAAQGVTSKWQITKPALNHEIEGYASATSINRGETIDFYISTVDPSFSLEIYRVGWYGGSGARLMSTTSLPGLLQSSCLADAVTQITECDWQRSFTLAVPNNTTDLTDWASGVYLVKLIGSAGKEQYVVFVVRDDEHTSDFLFQASFATYQAYNNWGGKSFYDSNSVGGQAATRISFNRPYARDNGAGDFLNWEIDLIQFMEKEGYDVSYASSIDTHVAGARILNHKAFLSVGHDEYWTKETRDTLERTRDAGIHLGFLGANAGFWQIRIEPDSKKAVPNRTLVGYRSLAPTADPVYGIHPELTGTQFRSAEISRPEAKLIGVMYDYNSVDLDMVISDCTSFICAGTSLVQGSRLPHMLGVEVDRLDTSSPAGIQVFAISPYNACLNPPTCSKFQARNSQATFYQAPSGAGVFATGSMQWNWGLSQVGPHTIYANPAVQQMTRNVLNRFSGKK